MDHSEKLVVMEECEQLTFQVGNIESWAEFPI